MRRRRIRTDGTSSRPFRPRPAVAFRVVRSVRFLGSVIIVPPCRCCIGPGSRPETAPSPCLILLAVRYGRGAIDPASRVAGSMTVRGSRPHTRSNVTIGSPPGPRSSTSKAPTPARMRVECHLGPAWYRLPSNRDRASAVRFHAPSGRTRPDGAPDARYAAAMRGNRRSEVSHESAALAYPPATRERLPADPSRGEGE